MNSRNFTIEEIAHRGINSSELTDIAYFQMGIMQMIRDYLSWRMKKEVSIQCTSGYRDEKFNKVIGGVDGSNHIWREEDGFIRCAGDYRFFDKNTKEQIPCMLILQMLEPFQGEIYHNKKQDIIHIGQQGGIVKPHFSM